MSEKTTAKSADLRARRSQKYLIEAFFALVQTKPLQKITVGDITTRAMVNRSTFYAHFVDKYDLFKTAIGQRMRHDLQRELGGATGLSAGNHRALFLISGALMTKILGDCQQSPTDELTPVIMQELQDSLYEAVLLWANTLEISKADAKALAMFTAGVVFGAVWQWGKQPDQQQSIEDLADQMMPLLTDGIRRYTV